MADRESVRPRMGTDVVEAEWDGFVDEDAEHPATTWQVSDRRPRHVVDSHRDEPLELAAVWIQDADRRVFGARELSRGVEHAPEHQLEVELRHEVPPDVDQAPKTRMVG